MPSEHSTSVTSDLAFTNHTVYSYSECGNYDDTVGWTVCNGCGATVADEYDAVDEDEYEVHVSGACIPRKAERKAVLAICAAFGSLFKVCEFCHHVPCDCPF